MRKASAPALSNFRIMAGLLDAGPSVARILTLRDRGGRLSVNGCSPALLRRPA